MSKTIAEAVAYARKQADAAAREAEMVEKIAGALPFDLVIDHLHVTMGEAWLALTVANRGEALALLDRLPAVPLTYIKGTFTSIKPAEKVTERDRNNTETEISDLLPAVFEFEPTTPRSSLKWWTRTPAGLMRVEARLASDPAQLVANHERDARGRITRHVWREAGFPSGEIIRWSSGDPKTAGNRTVWFYQEPGGAAPTLATYLLESLHQT